MIRELLVAAGWPLNRSWVEKAATSRAVRQVSAGEGPGGPGGGRRLLEACQKNSGSRPPGNSFIFQCVTPFGHRTMYHTELNGVVNILIPKSKKKKLLRALTSGHFESGILCIYFFAYF